jgi:hypothetical protein
MAAEPTTDDVLGDEEEELEVSLDLVAEDEALRAEAVGEPTRVRLASGIITIPHIKTWEYSHTRFHDMGAFDDWASAVLSADDFKIWKAAHLENYQVDRIVSRMLELARVPAGQGNSRASTKRRSGRARR